MRVLCVVPARGGSVGIKKKNLQEIHGISLVGWATIKSIKSGIFDKIIVSTDSLEIAEEGIKYGATFNELRPQELSTSFVPDYQVLRHELFKNEAISGTKYDFIAMLQPTSPLRTIIEIQESFAKLLENHNDSIWTVTRIDSKYHFRKQLHIVDEKLQLVFDGPLVKARQELSKVYIRNGSVYLLSRKVLIEKDNLLGEHPGWIESVGIRPNIDNINELEYCREISEIRNGDLVERNLESNEKD